MKRPLFSCVIPVKGARPYFSEATESLRAQMMGGDLEVIVQDADIEPDGGQSEALNRGFAKTHGDWLFWLNADDVLLPGALEDVRRMIARYGSEVSWIAGNNIYLAKDGRACRCAFERGYEFFYRHLPVRTFGPSSFFRRELLERCGSFDESLHYCMDTDMWCRFRNAGIWFKKTSRYLWGFRVHEASKTRGVRSSDDSRRMMNEIAVVNGRAGVNHWRLRTLVLRIVRMLDGSSLKAIVDTLRFSGRRWKDVSQ